MRKGVKCVSEECRCRKTEKEGKQEKKSIDNRSSEECRTRRTEREATNEGKEMRRSEIWKRRMYTDVEN